MDLCRQEILGQINTLIGKLEQNQSGECRVYGQTAGDARGLPPDRPTGIRQWQMVTVDGRRAGLGERALYDEICPKRVPPWIRPRIPSVELKSGAVLAGCHCWRKNGLQTECRRSGCRGHPACLSKPLPKCCPGHEAPVTGVRKSNLLLGQRDRCPLPY